VRIRTRLFSLLLVALATVAVVALSACGGGSSGSGGDAKKLLSQAFSTPIKSATVGLDIEAKIDGSASLSQPISVKMAGPYQSQGKAQIPKLNWDLNVSGGGQTFSGKLISTGDNAFVGFQGKTYEVGQDKVKAYEAQLAQQGSTQPKSLKQLGIDPGTWLNNPKTAGDEDVAGTATTKITGGVNVEKLLNDLNSVIDKAGTATGQTTAQKLTPAQIQQAKQAIKNPTFEAFVAKGDKTLRKLDTTLNFTVPAAQRSSANGASGGTIKFSIQFSDVGKPVTVTAPQGALPITELQQQIQALTGGATGSSGSGSSGGTAPGGSGSSGGSGSGSGGAGSPSSQQFQKYAACIQKAGSDQAKVTACASLLQ
jgi:hypothetical protein